MDTGGRTEALACRQSPQLGAGIFAADGVFGEGAAYRQRAPRDRSQDSHCWRPTYQRVVVTGDSRHLLGSVEDLADIGTAPAYPHGRLMVAPTRRYPFDVRMAVGVSGGIFGRRNRWCGRHWRGGVLARAPIFELAILGDVGGHHLVLMESRNGNGWECDFLPVNFF